MEKIKIPYSVEDHTRFKKKKVDELYSAKVPIGDGKVALVISSDLNEIRDISAARVNEDLAEGKKLYTREDIELVLEPGSNLIDPIVK